MSEPTVRAAIICFFSIAIGLPFSVQASSVLDVDEVIAECDRIKTELGRKAAIRHWTEPANAGDAKAQFCLGLSIRTRVWIGPPDEDKEEQAARDARGALEWVRRSAEQGFAPAQEDLAWAYARGRNGVSQDWEKARDWMERSANQGSRSAHLFLGSWYSGASPFSDKQLAYRHLRLAIELERAVDEQRAHEMIEFFGLKALLEGLARGITAKERARAESWVESQLLKFSNH